jgi:hypothetical protein
MLFSAAGLVIVGKLAPHYSVVLFHLVAQATHTSLHSPVTFVVYRIIKKRRKAMARVAVDPGPACNAYQPSATWPLYAAGGYGAPDHSNVVLAKHPPFFTEAHLHAGIKRGASDSGPNVAKGVYKTPVMPGAIAQFYEGTAPPLVVTPPPSARRASNAVSPSSASSAVRNQSQQKIHPKPQSRHQ